MPEVKEKLRALDFTPKSSSAAELDDGALNTSVLGRLLGMRR